MSTVEITCGEIRTVAQRIELLGRTAVHADTHLPQRLADEEVPASTLELPDLFDAAPIALHLLGPDGTVLRVNPAELELLGYTEEEYVGHHIAEFHADASVIEDLLARLSRSEMV